MACKIVFLCVIMFSAVFCKPTEYKDGAVGNEVQTPISAGAGHRLWKRFINPDLTFGGFSDAGLSRMRTRRFINPSLTYGDFSDTGLAKMRTRRSYEDECEKLNLCKLHARSQRNFIAAFELYFVNRENARLWDHQARSQAECQRRFSGCYDR